MISGNHPTNQQRREMKYTILHSRMNMDIVIFQLKEWGKIRYEF